MDQYLDNLNQWIQTKVITYSLITWHWITWAFELSVGLTNVTVRGIRNAHTPEIWLFRERNECPWRIHRGQDEHPSLEFTNVATWIPSHQRLYFRQNDSQTNQSFNDVVTAELYNTDKRLQYDLSSFFHTFSWRSASAAPSLYEVVLLYCLSQNLFFSKAQLEGFTLEIMTAEGDTILATLSSAHTRIDFEGWAEYHEQEDTGSEASSVTADAS
jgi:hypothetical protein